MPDTSFPHNILDALGESLAEYMDDHKQIRRPLRHTDPNRSIGMFPTEWTPVQDSILMGHQSEPTLNRYEIRIQLLVKAGDEVTGRSMFALSSKTLRVVLYRDPNLVVRLGGLTETLLGHTESVKRFGVTRQRFLNNELQGSLMYLATTDLWLETESRKTS